MTRSWYILLVISLSGCLTEEPASDGVQVLVPEDFMFPWHGAYDQAADGFVALVPFDVMVYDGATGAALPGVDVSLRVDRGGLLRVEDVEAADPADRNCARCLWDTWSDRPVILSAGGLSEARETQDRRVVVTGPDGLARVYLYIDTLPSMNGEGGEAAVQVVVRSGASEHLVRVRPR